MHCSQCGFRYEGAYCPACGAPAAVIRQRGRFCGHCGSPAYGDFCAYCGAAIPLVETAPLMPAPLPPGGDFRKLASLAWASVIVLYVGIVASVVVFFLWASVEVFSGILAGGCDGCLFYGIVITPAPVLIFAVEGIPMLVWFGIVVLVLCTGMILGTLTWGKDLGSTVRDGLFRMRANFRTRNPWAVTAQLFAAAWFFDFTYLRILAGAGIEPTNPVDPGTTPQVWYFLFQLINAAVYEELIARVLLIGLPLLVASAVASVRTGGGALPPRRALLGGRIPVGPKEVVLVGFSASMFGVAHIFVEPSVVDLTRLPPAFFGGLVLGYLFLRFGLIYSMLFHFVWNSFVGMIAIVGLGDVGPGLILAGIFAIIVALAGFPSFLLYARYFLRFFVRTPPAAPKPEPKPGPVMPFWFQCGSCGWPEAVYEAGSLRCTRCGATALATPAPGPPPGYG